MCKSTDLSGFWRIALDPADVGVESAWFSRELPGGEEIKLPGSIQEAGFGDPPSLDTHWTGAIQDRSFFEDPRYTDFHAPDTFKMPCWLTPQRVYQGACWFQRRIRLEEAGVWMELFLERCHWFTRVWLGDRELGRGESVWLRLKPRDIATELKTAFSPIFWNTAWTRGQAPHTLGILCDPSHPALAAFPTEPHSDVQWWSILRHAAPMELDRLGWTQGGIVSLIPDWNRPRPLSIAFEARVNRGRILVTSVDFDAEGDAALRQFESSLLQNWTTAPPPDLPEITPDRLRSLLK